VQGSGGAETRPAPCMFALARICEDFELTLGGWLFPERRAGGKRSLARRAEAAMTAQVAPIAPQRPALAAGSNRRGRRNWPSIS
jgi:hypothetical protein